MTRIEIDLNRLGKAKRTRLRDFLRENNYAYDEYHKVSAYITKEDLSEIRDIVDSWGIV